MTRAFLIGAEPPLGYTYVKEGEYYYIKGANPYTLIRILEELKTVLNLDMVIAYR